MKKNRISLIISGLITVTILILFFVSYYKKPYYPIFMYNGEVSNQYLIKVENNKEYVDYVKPEMKDLEKIELIYSSSGITSTSGEINIDIFDESKKIYENTYKVEKLKDLEHLNMDFYVQKDSINKEYKIVIGASSLKKGDYITFLGINRENKIMSDNKVKVYSLLAGYRGEIKSYKYVTVLFIFVIFSIFIFFLINVKKYKLLSSKILSNVIIKNILLCIISFIGAYSLIYTFIGIHSNVVFSSKFIIIAIICISLLLYNITYELKEKNIPRLFLALAIPIGIIYILFEVPGSSPDEWYHFVSIYKVTHLNFSNMATFPTIGSIEYNNYMDVYNNIINQAPNLEYKTVPFIQYPALLYLFNIIGFCVSSLFKLPIVIRMYFASFFNFMFYLFGGYHIIKRIPFYKILLLLYMMTPLFFQQSTSITVDLMINMCSLYFISTVLDIYVNKKNINKFEFYRLLVLIFFIFISKFAYFPVILILLLIKKQILDYIKDKKFKVILPILLTVVLCFGELYYHKVYMRKDFGNPGKVYLELSPGVYDNKMKYTLSSINKVFAVVINTFEIDLNDYITDFAGSSLKYDEVILPSRIAIVFYSTLIMCVLFETKKLSLKKSEKYLLLIIFIINSGIIFGGIYQDGWIRNLYVQGVQGRYFIPILLLPLLAIKNFESKIDISDKTKLVIVSSSIIYLNYIAIKLLFLSYF